MPEPRPDTLPAAQRLRALVFNKALYSEMKQEVGRRIVAEGWHTQALEMAWDPDPRVAFRIFWGLEHAFFLDPGSFAPHTGQFLDTFIHATNPSAMRHCVNILWGMLRRGTVLAPQSAGPIAEKCFDLLIDPKMKVAVKARAMDILMSLAPSIPWVGEELEATVRAQMPGASPGLSNKGSKILLALRKAEKYKK